MSNPVGFWDRAKLLFGGLFYAKAIKKSKEEIVDLIAGQEMHTEAIIALGSKVEDGMQFRAITANAVTNLDTRLEALEKVMGHLYGKAQEQEGRVSNLEARAVEEDLGEYQKTTSLGSKAN